MTETVTDLVPVGRHKPSTELTVDDLPTYPATMWGLLEARVAATPDRVILTDDTGRSLTARQWRDTAEQVAAALWARGVSADTPVSWQLPTNHEAAMVLMALCRLGAVQNPIIPILRHREVGFIVAQTGARLLITPSVWRNFDYGAMAGELAGEHGFDTLVVDRGGLPLGDPATLPPPPTGDGDPVRWVLYSSGTTADPKGAKHTDASLMASANGPIINANSDDVMPLPYPYTHVGGVAVTVSTLYTGSQLFMIEIFNPEKSPLVMSEYGVTRLGSSLPFFMAYADAQRKHGPEPLYPKLVTLSSGGAPKPPELFYEMKQLFGVPILSAWGLTEFPIATGSFIDDLDEDLAVAEGRALPGIDLKIVAPDGTVLPPGEEGEVLVRGPQALKGYVDSSLDAAAFDSEGYFRTGDLGRGRTEGPPADHRPDQGHHHPQRREPLGPRDRGRRLHPPQGVRRGCHRRARPPDRRAGMRRGRAGRGRGHVDADRGGRLLPRPAAGRPEDPRAPGDRSRAPRNPMGKILKQELRKRYS